MNLRGKAFHQADIVITTWMSKNGLTFHVFPIALTLEGQYIVKNIVLISAGIVLGATVRGGKLTPAG
ncbi:MAG: hypothetical protein JXQ80_01515 [Bacteroidales bacterium]|nr:hypothetical protein [Bacteroidales bacterium]